MQKISAQKEKTPQAGVLNVQSEFRYRSVIAGVIALAFSVTGDKVIL